MRMMTLQIVRNLGMEILMAVALTSGMTWRTGVSRIVRTTIWEIWMMRWKFGTKESTLTSNCG